MSEQNTAYDQIPEFVHGVLQDAMTAAATRQREERARLQSQLDTYKGVKADADRLANENAALLRSLGAMGRDLYEIYTILRNGGYGSAQYAEWMERMEAGIRRERGTTADQERVLDPYENEVMRLHENQASDDPLIGRYVTAKLRHSKECRQGWVVRVDPLEIRGESGTVYPCEGAPTLVVNPPEPKCHECGCTGDLVFGPHPYEKEINGNATPVWMCLGCLDEAEGEI